MKKIVLASVLAGLLALSFAAQANAYDGAKAWRFGGSYVYPTDSHTRDVLDNGWGVNLERSISAPELKGDISAAFGFKRFTGDFAGFSNDLNAYSLGLNWRIGPGASPATEGYYVGAGAGVAWLDANVGPASDTDTNFMWKLMGGVNFAQSWYGEVSYDHAGSVVGADANNLAFTLGYRF